MKTLIDIIEEQQRLDEKFGDVIDAIKRYFSAFHVGRKNDSNGAVVTIDADPVDHDSIAMGIEEVMKRFGYTARKSDDPNVKEFVAGSSMAKVTKQKKSRTFTLAFNFQES